MDRIRICRDLSEAHPDEGIKVMSWFAIVGMILIAMVLYFVAREI